MSATFMRRGEILAGATLAALGLYISIESLRWPVLSAAGPGPGFFPLGYGTLMVVLSVALIVRAATGRQPVDEDKPTNWRGIAAALIVWGAFVLTIPLMQYFGFMIAIGLLMAFVAHVIYSRPILYSLIAGAATPVLFYAIFTLLLQVRLPVGSLTGF